METIHKWKDIPVKEKIQYSLAIMFGAASIIIGFIAFILLMEIPGSVIGISALWASICCGILGISLHFKNQMIDFQTKVNDRLKKIDDDIEKIDNLVDSEIENK